MGSYYYRWAGKGIMKPSRGEIWSVNLSPIKGHEQGGRRPCFVISVNLFNHGPAGLVVVLPITTKNKNIPFHVDVVPPEGGVKIKSYIKCEDIRSVSLERLSEYWGNVSLKTIAAIEDRIRILLGL